MWPVKDTPPPGPPPVCEQGTKPPGRPRRVPYEPPPGWPERARDWTPPGWQSLDLGLGERLYPREVVPQAGATHPHLLGLYDARGDLDRAALAAFEPTRCAHRRMRPAAAEGLRIDRHTAECNTAAWQAGERDDERDDLGPRRPLSRWCWCVACGALFEDARVARGEQLDGALTEAALRPDGATRSTLARRVRVGGIDDHGLRVLTGGVARWCVDCRRSRRRHLPATTECSAPGCARGFVAARRGQETCCNACRKALGEARRAHAHAERAMARLERQLASRGATRTQRATELWWAGFGPGGAHWLPCARSAARVCMCPACLHARVAPR